MNHKSARSLINILRPYWLLTTASTYAIGIVIAHYLGIPLNWSRILLGIFWLFSLQIGCQGLDLYFMQPLSTRKNSAKTDQNLWAGIGALCATAIITITLVRSNFLNFSSFIIMILLVGGMMIAVIPPPRLIEKNYRELTLSILGILLVPALGFLLQTESLHRFVSMSILPLVLLHISAQITFNLQKFGHDSRHENKTLLVSAGWQSGISIINVLNLSAFFLLGFGMLAGIPNSIVWPTFLVFPLVLFQIWYFSRITTGAKPHWRILSSSASSIFVLTGYFLFFGFLTH